MTRLPRRRAHWFQEPRPSESLTRSMTVFVAPEIKVSYHTGYDVGMTMMWDTSMSLSELARQAYADHTLLQWTHFYRGFKDAYERQGKSVIYGERPLS